MRWQRCAHMSTGCSLNSFGKRFRARGFDFIQRSTASNRFFDFLSAVARFDFSLQRLPASTCLCFDFSLQRLPASTFLSAAKLAL